MNCNILLTIVLSVLFFSRSENTNFKIIYLSVRPNIFKNYNFLSTIFQYLFLLIIIFMFRLLLSITGVDDIRGPTIIQTNLTAICLNQLLLISGIEPNPGPSLNDKLLLNPTFDASNGVIYGNSIPEKCSSPNCNEEIFAACHCTLCKGYGPLLCYQHFLNNLCRSNLTTRKRNPTFSSGIECTICFAIISLNQTGINLSTYNSINNANGKFIYICKSCTNANDTTDQYNKG